MFQIIILWTLNVIILIELILVYKDIIQYILRVKQSNTLEFIVCKYRNNNKQDFITKNILEDIKHDFETKT